MKYLRKNLNTEVILWLRFYLNYRSKIVTPFDLDHFSSLGIIGFLLVVRSSIIKKVVWMLCLSSLIGRNCVRVFL